MAELLVVLVSAKHSDPVKDTRGSYKRGDVVVGFPDGHEWGSDEGPPKFGIMRIPGRTRGEIQKYTEPETETIEDFRFPDGSVGRHTFRKTRRLFQVDISSLSRGQRTDLEAGFLSTSFADVRGSLRNKATGDTE